MTTPLYLFDPPKRSSGARPVIDNFAGGGGASLALELAGFPVDVAINHDPDALAMHAANHPNTRHLCESVFKVDPLEVTGGRQALIAWFSPDCTHFSRAKGAKPVKKSIRALAWVAVKWARSKARPSIMFLENVREFEDWGPLTKDDRPCPVRKGLTFKRFIGSLRNAGYDVDWRVLNAADYGAPTHRRRLFLVARCDGQPICWPTPTHGPKRSQPWRTAAECIDWSIPCPSIFDRKRPLAEKTLRRIAMGIKRYVIDNPKPFIVTVNHGGEDFRGQSIDAPLTTVSAKHGYGVVAPTLAQIGYGEREGQSPRAMDVQSPLGTCVSSQKHGLVSAFLSKYHGQKSDESRCTSMDAPTNTLDTSNRYGLVSAHLIKFRGESQGHNVNDPMPTVTSGAGASRPAGAAHALGIVTSHLTQFRGTNDGGGGDLQKPMPAVTAQGTHIGEVRAFLIKYFSTGGQLSKCDAPSPTVTTKDRIGLVTVEGVDYQIVDIGLRMLTPRELARAQGFPDSYILTGPKSEQVAKIGNSVSPPCAAALVKANMAKAHEATA